ncbi:MAG: hypothetical protein ACLFPL_05545 [Candidatus Nanoarchaeia archaeon]
MRWTRVVSVIFIIFFLCSSSYSLYINHTVEEEQFVEEKLNSDYELKVSGTLHITNPSLNQTIDELKVTINTPQNVFGGFNSISSNDNTSTAELIYQGFQEFEFEPNSTLSIDYSFSGVIKENEFLKLQNGNTSFLEVYLSPVYILNPHISVEKLIMESENQTIQNPLNSSEFITSPNKTFFNSSDSSQSFTQEPMKNSSTRVVGSTVKNPSEFNLRGNFLEIQRSNISHIDTLFEVGEIQNFTVAPYSEKNFNFYDDDSFEGAIYWVRSEVGAMWNWSRNISFSFTQEQNPTGGGGGGSSTGGGGAIGGGGGDDSSVSDLVITKRVDKFFVERGQNLTVTLRVMNLGRDALENISFSDIIPEGYSLVRVNNANVDGNRLDFSIDKLEGYSEVEFKYILVKNEDSSQSFTYFTPVEYDGDAILEGALVLEELLGDTSILVQKKVERVDSDFSKVKITIRNVGNNKVGSFRIFDRLNERYLIKEISQPFYLSQRGVWEISSLAPNEVYEIEYLVETHPQVSQFPSIVGIEDSKVYTSVLIDSFVDSAIDTQSSSLVSEKVGLFVALFLLLIYLLY